MISPVYLNGRWLNASEATVSVFDRGFLFADGIYEVIPFYQGFALQFDQHIARLQRSLQAVGITVPYSHEEWLSICQTLVETTPQANGVVYIQVTRGTEYPRQHLPNDEIEPTIMATVSAWEPPQKTAAPVRVVALEDTRWLRCDIKSVSLLGNILLKQEASRLGAFEPLLHRQGRVTEGASCNFFIVKDQVLYTPPADHLILGGITRDWIIQLAEQDGLQVQQTSFTLEDMRQADECFLSSSTREIQPVSMLDDTAIGAGSTGEITETLAQLFRAHRPA